MLRTRVIPVLLLRNEGLVKTVKFKSPRYVGDAINAIKIFNDKEVDELVLLDIEATKKERGPNFELIEQIATECFMPFCYGGGIRNIEDARKLFALGVEKVAINSEAIVNPEFIKELSSLFGSQSIVVSIDVKKNWLGKYQLFNKSGKKPQYRSILEFAKAMERNGAGELLVNSVDHDGTMQGYDTELIKSIVENISIPVIACGGAGKLEDMSELINMTDVAAVAAGSFFIFYGKHKAVLMTYPSQDELRTIERQRRE